MTGETPIVDIQSARRQQVLDDSVVSAIPTARTYHGLLTLVPGVVSTSTDVGGMSSTSVATFTIHGGRPNEGRLQLDGMGIGGTLNGGGTSMYNVDVGNAAEIVFTTSGGLGEAEIGGPVMSIVPRTGGNTLSGTFYANWANSALQGDNFTDELRAAGLSAPGSLQKMWDLNGSFGGPIAKDRVWYYLTSRYQGNRKYTTNMFYNRNAGDPTKWTYEADEKRAINDGTWKNTSLRLTLQANSQNTFNLYWDEQTIRIDHLGGGTPTTSPEAAATSDAVPLRTRQVTWRSPWSSRVLLEGGYSVNGSRWGGRERTETYVGGEFVDGNATRGLIRVVEQAGRIPNLTYRSMNWNSNAAWSNRWRGTASYITGAHSMKFGYEGNYLVNDLKAFTNDERLSYRFNNGVPNQLTMSGQPFDTLTRTGSHSAFVQDQSTFGRLTLQGALRFDYAYSRFLDQQVGPEQFIPVAIVLPASDGVTGFKDLSPARGRGLRPVRRRQDVAESELGPIPRAGGQRRPATPPPTRCRASSRRPPAAGRTRTATRSRTATCWTRPRRISGRAAATSAAPGTTGTSAAPSPARRWIRHCCRGGACGPTTGSSGSPCSGNCSRARPWKWAITAGGSAISTSPTTCWWRRRTSTRTASRRRRIRACPTAAGTSSAISGTSATRSSGRARTTWWPRARSATRFSTGTAWTSTSSMRLRNGILVQGGTSTGRRWPISARWSWTTRACATAG